MVAVNVVKNSLSAKGRGRLSCLLRLRGGKAEGGAAVDRGDAIEVHYVHREEEEGDSSLYFWAIFPPS